MSAPAIPLRVLLRLEAAIAGIASEYHAPGVLSLSMESRLSELNKARGVLLVYIEDAVKPITLEVQS